MIVLGLDTALQACSAILIRGDEVLAQRYAALEKGHAEHLAPMAAAVFAEAGLSPKAVDRVGVIIGPGGFTGVRVGLAFARALVLGTSAAAVGVVSLAALAAMVNGAGPRAAIIDARRGQVYAALYASDGAEILPPFIADPETVRARLAHKAGAEALILTGTGARLLPSPPENWTLAPGAGQIDPLIAARLAACAPEPQAPPAPLYLRPPDAKKAGPSLFQTGLS